MLMAVYKKPDRPACTTCFRFMPKPSAITEICNNSFASELLSLGNGCSTVKPNSIPRANAIGGEIIPLAATNRPIKKMFLP